MLNVIGKVNQIGYVVKDINKAMKQWLEIGVGPWYLVRKAKPENYRYMNQPSDMEMATALANIGDLQIELIQQLNDAPSLYQDFLRTSGEGMHHIAYWIETEKFDEKCKQLESAGYKVGHSGQFGANGRFVYYINDSNPSVIIELSERSGVKGKFFQAISEASVNWDGTNPIRG